MREALSLEPAYREALALERALRTAIKLKRSVQAGEAGWSGLGRLAAAYLELDLPDQARVLLKRHLKPFPPIAAGERDDVLGVLKASLEVLGPEATLGYARSAEPGLGRARVSERRLGAEHLERGLQHPQDVVALARGDGRERLQMALQQNAGLVGQVELEIGRGQTSEAAPAGLAGLDRPLQLDRCTQGAFERERLPIGGLEAQRLTHVPVGLLHPAQARQGAGLRGPELVMARVGDARILEQFERLAVAPLFQERRDQG